MYKRSSPPKRTVITASTDLAYTAGGLYSAETAAAMVASDFTPAVKRAESVRSATYTPHNIMVTGGTGFIASHVVIRLVQSYPQYKARAPC